MEPTSKRPRLEELGVLDDSFDNDESFVNQAAPSPDLNDSFEDESILEGPPLILTQHWNAQATQQQQQQQVLNERQNNVVQSWGAKPPPNPTQPAQTQHPWNAPNATQRPTQMARTSSKTLTQSARHMAQMEFQNASEQESGLVMMLRRQTENLRRDLDSCQKKIGMQAAARDEERKSITQAHKREMSAVVNERDTLKRQVLSMSMSASMINTSHLASGSQQIDMNTSVVNRSIVTTRPVERRVSMPRPYYPKPRTTKNKAPAATQQPNRSPVFKHPTAANETYQHFSTQQMATEESILDPPKPPVAAPPVAPVVAPLIPKIEPKVEPIERRNSECQTGNVDEEMMRHEGIVTLENDPRDDFLMTLLAASLRSDSFSISRLEPMLRGSDYAPLKRPSDDASVHKPDKPSGSPPK